jgi:hypothetical protein
MSTRQYGRQVHEWVAAVGMNTDDYGTHSLRRTKASIGTAKLMWLRGRANEGE